MNFGEMKQAVFDMLGVTGEVTMVERFINSSKDRYVEYSKWPHLEVEEDLALTTGVREYTLGTTMGHVLAMFTSAGAEIHGDVHRLTYNELYRGDTSTAANPELYIEQGTNTAGRIKIHTWKTVSEASTAKVRGLVRVPDIASASASVFQHIPVTHHFVVVELAQAEFREWEESEQAPAMRAKAERSLAKLAGETPRETLTEGA